MRFSEMLEAVRHDPAAVVIPAQWGQGRASFGGLVVALAYEALRARVAEERVLRSLATTFVGPVAADTPLELQVEVLREGSSVSQLCLRAIQNGQVMTLVQASFGAARTSSVAVEALPAPQIVPPEDCRELPFIPGLTPAFTRYLAMRWGLGGMPFSHDRSRQMGGWVRLREEPVAQPVTEAHLLALVDAWPPAVLSHLKQPAAGSSLTWTIEFVQPLPQLSSDDWCLYRAEIEHARDGYGHVAAGLWSAAGELIAISRQTVTVFG